MATYLIQFRKEYSKEFEDFRSNNEQLLTEIKAVSYSQGIYGMDFPDEVTFEEAKKDIESALLLYGYYTIIHYRFI